MTTLTDDQITKQIKDMLQSNEIGLYPQQNHNGADRIVCPSCRQSTDVMGNVSGMHGVKEGDHHDGCELMALVEAIENGAANAEIIDRTEELLREDALGLYPTRIDNGGDTISCPSCSASKTIQGYADSMYPLDQIEHHDDCELIKLADAINARSAA